MLEVKELVSGYGDMMVLNGVSMHVAADEIVTIIGPNGAGKSTLFKAIMGYLTVHKGKIVFRDEDITILKPYEKVRKGIGYVPQLENVFPNLTISENLKMGAYIIESNKVNANMKQVYKLFPTLEEKRNEKAGNLSGGQRIMLGLGRVLMHAPCLLLLDEPSAGLAPKVSTSVFEIIQELNKIGKTLVLVEQEAHRSLAISDRAYVLAQGQNEFDGDAQEVLSDPKIRTAYLGD